MALGPGFVHTQWSVTHVTNLVETKIFILYFTIN